MTSFIRALMGLFFLPLALADPYNLWCMNVTNNDRTRVWYGDGQAYIGNVVPREVHVAFNITASGDQVDLISLMTDRASSPGAPELPNPSLLAASMSPDATDPVFFASPRNLTQTDNYHWANFAGFFIPRTSINLVGGGFFLFPTTAHGTWNLRFFTDEDTALRLGGTRTHLLNKA